MAHALQPAHGWSICRDFQEFPVPDVDTLLLWAEHGRIHPDDYLVNAPSEACFQAKEVPELKAIFRRVRTPLHGILRALGL